VSNFWEGRSVFVTGAGGFVASWLAHRLAELGAQVTVVLRDEPMLSNFRVLRLGERLNMVRGSITDEGLVDRILNEYEVDSCFHLAAQAIVGIANRSPISTFESNIKGTWCVLEACRVSKTVERVVVASSDKAYGSQPVLPYTEDMALLGVNPYDASKACTDILARSYQRTFDMPLAIARCANIYGGGDLNFSRLIPGSIRSALAGERPIIRSDGTPVREYLYVDDAVTAYLTLGEHARDKRVCGNAFNFGTDYPISAMDLVRRILMIAGAANLEPDVRGTGRLVGEIDRQYLNSELAQRTLGWRPAIRLEEGLGRTVAWYRNFLDTRSQPAVPRLEVLG
jgi:CDP-glucose 4,6-dehydratase